ncbi:MAG TPA: polysaccharide biosynthesis protein [Alphaproteobacteria bacterium]|nr:polysaccharide biosynthesis protein [Alphaproteobacteria bacterium]
MILSLQISLFLRLGEDISQISISAIVFNTVLYVLFGISVFLGKHIYKVLAYYPALGELFTISLSVTYITFLYLPVMYILPPDLSLPRSTPFINWFVLIVLLWIPRLFHSPPQNKPLEVDPENLNLPSVKQPMVLEELLNRPHVSFNLKSLRAMIKGKRVLVTGAGGTIGKELVRQISKFAPSHICLFDHSEYLLYMADLEMDESHPKLPRDNILGDVACRERVRHIISTFKPELVFHAAALKHIPLGEENPSQAVLTNVIGTRNVADACRDFNVKAMLLVSTNEALNPTNTIGATKRLAECYCQALDILGRKKPNGTRYSSIRFGNVLGSSGSVIPLFMRQIERGGPVTITHPDIQRYFLTLDEAVELILEAMTFVMTSEVPAGRVITLDMGEPIKIADLARQMIRRAGFEPDVEIEIKFTGLRPGEKLTEDMSFENLSTTHNPNIHIDAPRTMDHGFLARALHELDTVAKDQDRDSLARLLRALVPEYKRSELEEESDTELES